MQSRTKYKEMPSLPSTFGMRRCYSLEEMVHGLLAQDLELKFDLHPPTLRANKFPLKGALKSASHSILEIVQGEFLTASEAMTAIHQDTTNLRAGRKMEMMLRPATLVHEWERVRLALLEVGLATTSAMDC